MQRVSIAESALEIEEAGWLDEGEEKSKGHYPNHPVQDLPLVPHTQPQ
jgi:hypothetical protein